MNPLLLRQCRHRHDISLPHTLLYCLALSSFFVLSLYALVPLPVRRLPRDNVQHIRWRAGVTAGVTLVGIGLYPWLFCRHGAVDAPPWYSYLGISWQAWQDLRIALHVVLLYLGAFSCAWLKIYHHARILHWEKEGKALKKSGSFPSASDTWQLPILPKPKYLRLSLKYTWIQSTVQSLKALQDDEDHRWRTFRNLGMAPVAEEVIFRACLLPPLLASRRAGSGKGTLSPTRASWIAPLFFGVAHLHHFYERYRTLPPYKRSKREVGRLLFGVVFQWTYTTLFGAYCSHVFIRTGSLLGVTVAHIMCNYMGLPDIGFAHATSELHGYRWCATMAYFVGIWLFIWGFDTLLPSESLLPALLQQGTQNQGVGILD